MAIQIFDTLSRQKQAAFPDAQQRVGMYLCGPTVYGDAHLGNAKTAVAFDVVRRWIEYRGHRVRFVSNVTDVGHITEDALDEGRDRIAERAALERVEPMEIADRYFWKYFDEMGRLNVRRPDVTPRASGHIPQQIELIEELLARGLAYVADGSVYFRVAAFPGYGKLSRRVIDELAIGTRDLVRGNKSDPRDFAMWKKAEPSHVQRWKSPWGEGFPGWHLECSAMGLQYLGEGFDIHAGGLDLQFPHHEAEIAQAEGAGRRFARLWMHGNMLTVNGEKMSRSKGNFTTLEDFYAKHDPLLLRFLFVQSHYRATAEVSAETLHAATSGLRRLRDLRRELARRAGGGPPGHAEALEARLAAARAAFEAAMDDDFDTPAALATLFVLARDLQAALAGPVPQGTILHALELVSSLGEGVLGLLPEERDAPDAERFDRVIALLLAERARHRAGREYARADALRAGLAAAGIEIEDGPDGARWTISA
ncbi:cysteine--tRNA ligase [Polyangium sp. 15x6]|uniref:cysteine--tRNA ligase n=1 Tax=Polyangium sp. 15x6 TaxID=3042687 RepID=UPI00249C71ED|nr:cysteine--tRNA ligase [Polyangium sp. 15x6]MDI3282155.1 cysteine--tRNA ligase [Polyangium sp. 15x6]